LLLAAQWMCALFLPSAEKARKTVWVSAGVISLFVAPLVFNLVFSDRSQLSWMSSGSASGFYRLFLDFSGEAGSPLLILYVVLLLVSIRTHLREPHQPGMRRTAYILIWVWLLLPVFVVRMISLYRPILQSRYLILCLPAFLILAADGLGHLSKATFVAAALARAGFSLVGVNSYYQARLDANQGDNWRDATNYWLSQVQSGDVVLFPYSAEEIPFLEYRGRFVSRSPAITIIPEKTDLELLGVPGAWTSPETVSTATSQHSRVWVMTALQPNSHSNQVLAALRASRQEESRRTFGFVTLELFVPAQSNTQ
jgi:hypothetical protein